MSGETVIETTDLRRTFRVRKDDIEAVVGVDLRVEAGTVFGFLGPNGAGKTTTLRMLSTLLPPTSGQARVAGFDVRREPRRVRERIGYVAQTGGTDAAIPGRAELVLQGQLFGFTGLVARARAVELLEAFELSDAADRPTGTYSGGMRRRLDVAIGMVHRPSVLFLDEPTTGLDPQARARMWEEIHRLREQGTAVFLTTHYLEEADALCDHLAIIDHGRIVAEGSPDELKRRVAGDAVTIGVRGDPAPVLALLAAQPYVRDPVTESGGIRMYVERGESVVPELLRLLDGAGIVTDTIAVSRPSLDDVFLRQTGRSLRETAA